MHIGNREEGERQEGSQSCGIQHTSSARVHDVEIAEPQIMLKAQDPLSKPNQAILKFQNLQRGIGLSKILEGPSRRMQRSRGNAATPTLS